MQFPWKQTLFVIAVSFNPAIFAQTENFSFLFKDGNPVSVSRTNNNGVSVAVTGPPGILLKDDKYTQIDFPPGTNFGFLYDVNDAGDVVGECATQAGAVSFLRKSNGAFTYLQMPEGFPRPFGLNNRGVVVGNFFLNSNLLQSQGFIYDHGSYTIVSIPGTIGIQLFDVNDSGDIVGKATTACTPVCQSYPFLYRNGNITPLPQYPGASTTEVRGINNRGEMAGWGFSQGQYTGFVLKDGQFETIRFPGVRVAPNGINDRGDVTGDFRTVPALDGTSFIRHPK